MLELKNVEYSILGMSSFLVFRDSKRERARARERERGAERGRKGLCVSPKAMRSGNSFDLWYNFAK